MFFIGIPEIDYNNSFEEFSKEQNAAKLIANMELEVREDYEPILPLRSKDEVKKIYCEHLDMEAENDMEQDLSQAENLAEAQAIMIPCKRMRTI